MRLGLPNNMRRSLTRHVPAGLRNAETRSDGRILLLSGAIAIAWSAMLPCVILLIVSAAPLVVFFLAGLPGIGAGLALGATLIAFYAIVAVVTAAPELPLLWQSPDDASPRLAATKRLECNAGIVVDV